MNTFKDIENELWKKQNKENWEKFRNYLKKSNAKYYKIIFEQGKINNEQDLRKSYAELFDDKKKLLGKIPIFMTEGKKLTGATIYLVGLEILNN
ncbi:MAG: hypothetical protein ACP5M9_02350 [Candidatus Micrarchaeia archaeon]